MLFQIAEDFYQDDCLSDERWISQTDELAEHHYHYDFKEKQINQIPEPYPQILAQLKENWSTLV